MSATVYTGAADVLVPPPRSIRIDVRNFGPIATGRVDLRPLTVFVGPSNTGKTYLAILIYALHKSLGGFQRLPASHSSVNFPYDLIGYGRGQISPSETPEELKQQVHDLLRIVDLTSLTYSELPTKVRERLRAVLQYPGRLGRDITLELERCLDSSSALDLIRTPGKCRESRITLRVAERGRELWHFIMKIAEDRTTVAGDIADNVELIRGEAAADDSKRSDLVGRLRDNPGPIYGTDLLTMTSTRGSDTGKIHYLPAARSGIMQSYRVIAGSLIVRSTRGTIDHIPGIPTLSGVIADFMQRIVLYSAENRVPRDEVLQELADVLQLETLAGQIGTRTKPRGYADFAYRPHGTRQDIRLTRASSMVSELAPLVLFLSGVIRVGDTLVMEEPEAHLHPAAQTQVAVTLARLVRTGVRVVITTHSDWLLKEIGNLIREGELAGQTGKPTAESALSSALHPSEVGIWLFRQDGADQGSTIQEIPFDRSEGVEPAEYDDVAEALYNRAADLQNKLEESRASTHE